jgi:hypothetical protein
VQLPIAVHRLLIQGALTTWENQDSIGNMTNQRFCSLCKTRLYSTNTGRAGMALVRGGTLEESDQLTPALHIWTKRKQPWIQLADQALAFAEAAPLDVSRALFAPNFAAE